MTDQSSGSTHSESRTIAVATADDLVVARDRLGLGKGEVAQRLKLHPRQLDAIERGDWEALPGRAFARGCVRAYGRLLGADVEPLLAAIGSVSESDGLRSGASLGAPLPRGGFSFEAEGGRSKLPWAVLGVIGVIAVGLFFGRDGDVSKVSSWLGGDGSPSQAVAPASQPGEVIAPAAGGATVAGGTVVPPPLVPPPLVPSPPVPSGAASVSASQVAVGSGTVGPAASGRSGAPVASGAGVGAAAASSGPTGAATAPAGAAASASATAAAAPAPSASGSLATPGAAMKPTAPSASSGSPPSASSPSASPTSPASSSPIRLTVRQDAWVDVRQADGKSVFVGIVKPGTAVDVSGAAPFSLTIGNASQVTLEYQGKPVELKPQPSNIARVKLP